MVDILGSHLPPISEDDLNRAIASGTPDDPHPSPRPHRTPAVETSSGKSSPALSVATPPAVAQEHPEPLLRASEKDTASISFQAGAIDLTAQQQSQLNDIALAPLSGHPSRHLEIRAYASPTPGEQNGDRRTALARGLAVREYLKGQGIEPDRIELKVLGAPIDQTNPDRVEMTIIGREGK